VPPPPKPKKNTRITSKRCLQSNGVNDNTDTRVRFTVQRRPHRSNRDARHLYDDDHDNTDTGVRRRRQIMQLLSHYTRTCTCQTSPSYSMLALHTSLRFSICRQRPVLPQAWTWLRDTRRDTIPLGGVKYYAMHAIKAVFTPAAVAKIEYTILG